MADLQFEFKDIAGGMCFLYFQTNISILKTKVKGKGGKTKSYFSVVFDYDDYRDEYAYVSHKVFRQIRQFILTNFQRISKLGEMKVLKNEVRFTSSQNMFDESGGEEDESREEEDEFLAQYICDPIYEEGKGGRCKINLFSNVTKFKLNKETLLEAKANE